MPSWPAEKCVPEPVATLIYCFLLQTHANILAKYLHFCRYLVAAGDPCQLLPIIASPAEVTSSKHSQPAISSAASSSLPTAPAVLHGLGRPLFLRLVALGHVPHLLRRQYRYASALTCLYLHQQCLTQLHLPHHMGVCLHANHSQYRTEEMPIATCDPVARCLLCDELCTAHRQSRSLLQDVHAALACIPSADAQPIQSNIAHMLMRDSELRSGTRKS